MSRDQHSISEEDLRNYLLGRADEATRDLIEDLTFSEAAFYDYIRTAQSDLIEDYQSGRLDDASRSAVERLLLSTRDGRREARVAAALRDYQTRLKEEPARRWQKWLRPFSTPALTFASIAGMAIFAVLYMNTLKRVNELTVREESLRQAVTAAENRLRAQQEASTNERSNVIAGIATFNLFPDEHVRGTWKTTRSETVRIAPGARELDLRVQIASPARSNLIGSVRRSSNSRILWNGNSSGSDESSVTFRVPAAVFDRGRYRLIVREGGGVQTGEVVAESNFSVEQTADRLSR